MIERLRPAWSAEDLARIYATPHDHRLYGRGHDERVKRMIEVGRRLVRRRKLKAGADLSCGNGAVLLGLPLAVRYFGDLAPGYAYTGPIERTIEEVPVHDLLVMGETLEHLDDPGAALSAGAGKARYLLLSTPVDNWGDANDEHYWAWDRAGVVSLMLGAGWLPTSFSAVDSREWGEPYCYGIWAAERAA